MELPSSSSSSDPSRNAKESLELAYQISNILGTGLDRHALSLLIALLDRGVNPEALSALVRELGSSTVGTGSVAGGGAGSSNGFATGAGSSSFRSNFRQY